MTADWHRELPRVVNTAAIWTSANPVLVLGERGLEADTGKEKVGDGTTAWTGLTYRLTPTVGDVTFPVGFGPVVHDASDGHTYRLGTAAGVVTATQVT